MMSSWHLPTRRGSAFSSHLVASPVLLLHFNFFSKACTDGESGTREWMARTSGYGSGARPSLGLFRSCFSGFRDPVRLIAHRQIFGCSMQLSPASIPASCNGFFIVVNSNNGAGAKPVGWNFGIHRGFAAKKNFNVHREDPRVDSLTQRTNPQPKKGN